MLIQSCCTLYRWKSYEILYHFLREHFSRFGSKLVKNSTQQKLFQISDGAKTSTCEDYISKTKIAMGVIPVAYEKYRSLFIPRKISWSFLEQVFGYDQKTTDCSKFQPAQLHHLVIFITPNPKRLLGRFLRSEKDIEVYCFSEFSHDLW